MSECPSSTLRNTRKHFVKCVDCDCQTLPQNASKERPWAAAASLYISGLVNDGALCFNCANKRRGLLGLPLEKGVTRSEGPASTCESTLKKVRINTREYSWEISTLESLLTKWRDECLAKSFMRREIKYLIVAVNNEMIPANDFSSMPISDGDTICIVVGAVSGG
jgi:thiamine biosynthesis protein ThiS